MKVTVQRVLDNPKCPVPSTQEFNRWAMAIDQGDAEVCVRIVDNREARALNRYYRQQSYVPNVLAFPYVAPPPAAENYLGDVVIALRQVIAEAQQRRIKVQQRWAQLFVHGVLHLQGYDHRTESQRRRMQLQETAVLKKLNFASPYADEVAQP